MGAVQAFLEAQARLEFTYPAVGATVKYGILAFSRPNQLLVHLGYPLVHRLQKRFARDSAAAMLRAVKSAQVGNHAALADPSGHD